MFKHWKKKMSNEELNHQEDKQENKEEKKSTLRRVLGIIIILDLLLVIILLILFGLKSCKSYNSSSSFIESSSSERYDSDELDGVFKKIVKTQMDDYGFDEDPLLNIVAVSYVDNSSSFDLTISVISSTKVYIYKIENSGYQGYDNFVSFLLANNNNTPLNGVVSLNKLTISNDEVTTSKSNNHYAVGKNDLEEEYLSGYYYDESGYHIYHKLLLDNTDPFTKQENQIINSNDLLYGYYKNINV